MKLSNKILIAFFGFIFLYMTAVFAEIRFRGNPSHADNSNSIAETVSISGITHVEVNDLGYTVNLTGSDHPRLEVRSTSGTLLKNLKYTLAGDTLTLLELEKEQNKYINIEVYIPESLTAITLNSAKVDIRRLVQQDLSITQNGGYVRLIESNRFERLHVDISDDAQFEILAAEVETLSADIDGSEALIYTPVHLLKGSLKNNSYMRMTGVEEIQFTKDKSSTLHFY